MLKKIGICINMQFQLIELSLNSLKTLIKTAAKWKGSVHDPWSEIGSTGLWYFLRGGWINGLSISLSRFPENLINLTLRAEGTPAWGWTQVAQKFPEVHSSWLKIYKKWKAIDLCLFFIYGIFLNELRAQFNFQFSCVGVSVFFQR